MISETVLTILLVSLHILYLLTSIGLVIYFDVSFVISSGMNLFLLTYLLKGISYCHVLYSIRFYSSVLNKEIPYDNFRLEQELNK